VSLITIKGVECNVRVLSTLCEPSGGIIERVDPEGLDQSFADVLHMDVAATDVVIMVKLHRFLKFRNEQPQDLVEENNC